MALSPAEMDAAVVRNLPTKTGRSLEDWHALLVTAGPFAKPAAAVAWLKAEHGLGHVTAQIIVRTLAQSGAPLPTEAERLAGLFGAVGMGPRDLFERLRAALVAAIPESRLTVGRTYAGFGNPVQFLAVHPVRGRDELVLGLAAFDPESGQPPAALRLGGSDRIRYRLEFAAPGDIDMVLRHARASAALGRGG